MPWIIALGLLLAVGFHFGRQTASWFFLHKTRRLLTQNITRASDQTQALRWLRLAQTTAPDNPLTHFYQGLFHLRAGQGVEADLSFQRFAAAADQDLGYFLRVLYTIPRTTDSAARDGHITTSVAAAMVTSTAKVVLPPIDLALHEVGPSTAVLFAWVGLQRNDPTLVQSALGCASTLDGRSSQYHAVRGFWSLLTGKSKEGIQDLERALALVNSGATEGSSDIGLVPCAVSVNPTDNGLVASAGPWIGRLATPAESTNALTAQLVTAVATITQHRSEYRRSIELAEFALARFGSEATRLGHRRTLERLSYPINFQAHVLKSSVRHGQDPMLVLSLMRQETHFDPLAVSPVGARGLMQVMPKTGAWIAAQLKWAAFSDQALFNPADNIEFGTWYIGYLRKLVGPGDDLLPWVIAAYNGGIGNVRKWMAAPGWTAGSIESIEFPETRTYVRRVQSHMDNYRRLYGMELPGMEEARIAMGVPAPKGSPPPRAVPKESGRRKGPGRRSGRGR